jgi:serine/threonine protein kinase
LGLAARQDDASEPGVERADQTADHAPEFEVLSPSELAKRLPQFEILKVLGQGGMGAVYAARQTSLNRLVALKIIKPGGDTRPDFAERFTREAQTLARLNHPSIVTVHDFGRVDTLYYLVMEYVDGVNLRQVLQAGELKPEEALGIVPQICEALAYAHEEGVVHRDIKPENILVDSKGRIKVADFGLARLLRPASSDPTLTQSHQVMGTPRYMAPEQVEHPLSVDHRADIYSLGVVFYEMLTGELPMGRFAPPSTKVQLDVRLDDVVLRSLEKEPSLRYQQASDIKTDVEQILGAGFDRQRPPIRTGPSAGKSERTLFLPFLLRKHGERVGHGVARFDGDRIELEYELKLTYEVLNRVHRFVGGSEMPPDSHKVSVSLDEIVSLNLKTGWFSSRLILQTSSLRLFAGIPGADGGRITLCIGRDDTNTCRKFVQQIEQRLWPGLEPEHVEPPAKPAAPGFAPPKPGPPGDVEPAETLHDRLRIPAVGIALSGFINCAAAMVPILLIGQGIGVLELLIIVVPGVLAGTALIGGGFAMLFGNSRAVATATGALAVVPCGAGWLVSMPFGIWTLILAVPNTASDGPS